MNAPIMLLFPRGFKGYLTCNLFYKWTVYFNTRLTRGTPLYRGSGKEFLMVSDYFFSFVSPGNTRRVF